MKRLFLISTLIFSVQLLSAAINNESENEISSSISEVTVYAQNAYITRMAKFEIKAGQQFYRVTGLSPYINQNTIQVKGTGDIIIHSFQYEVNYITSIESSAKIKGLIDQINNLERQIQVSINRINILVEKKDLLDKNKRLQESGASVQELIKLEEYFDRKLTEIANETLELNYHLKDLREQKSLLDQQLAEFNQNAKTPSGEILVKVESNKAFTSSFEISYLTGNAGWSPAYDLKVKDIESDINLVFKANLFNNTREDWENVNLVFSNGNPNFSAQLPELHPWYLDFVRYQEYRKQRSSASRRAPEAGAVVQMEDDALFEEPEIKVMPTQFVESQTTMEIELDRPYSLASNNESIQISLRSFDVPSSYQYQVVPKLDRNAYLVASIENWDQRGLLNGPANLYFENRFIGKSYINTQQLSDRFNISLGRDKSIVVKREMVDIYNKKNLVGSTKIDRRGFRVSIRNTKSKDINILIHDQIPVSTNSDIVIKALELGEAKYDQSTGKLIWDWTVKSGSTQNTEFSFEVRYPKGEVIPL